METLNKIFSDLKNKSEDRYRNFKIEEIYSIKSISDKAFLEKPVWLGGEKKYICVFIDLNNSTLISNYKNRREIAKLYDYFTQNIVDVFEIPEMKADYIDIKGDGAFGLYEGEKAMFKGFVAAVTFKTFFIKFIKNKFITLGENLKVKIAMNMDMILVKKIGRRDFYNEVWAGKLINNAYKISSLNEKIIKYDKNSAEDIIIVSEDIYNKLKLKKDFTIWSCGHDTNGNSRNKRELWEKFIDTDADAQYKETVYYLKSKWCDICGDLFLSEILR